MEILEYIERNIHDFNRDILDIERFLNGTCASYSFFQANYPDVVKEFSRKE